MRFPKALQPAQVTILGYGALQSESSSRLTFPDLTNFRHVRVKNMRRVFGHPHLFLLNEEGLYDASPAVGSLKIASLSAEPVSSTSTNNSNSSIVSSSNCISFVAAAFDVTLDDAQRIDFIKREPEYKITTTPFFSLEDDEDHHNKNNVNYGNNVESVAQPAGEGVICVASQDAAIPDVIKTMKPSNIPSVWHLSHDSGILPFDIYLRHCLLSVEKVGGKPHESFLHETYLADRHTTLAEYLDKNGEEVLASRPPPHLAARFSG